MSAAPATFISADLVRTHYQAQVQQPSLIAVVVCEVWASPARSALSNSTAAKQPAPPLRLLATRIPTTPWLYVVAYSTSNFTATPQGYVARYTLMQRCRRQAGHILVFANQLHTECPALSEALSEFSTSEAARIDPSFNFHWEMPANGSTHLHGIERALQRMLHLMEFTKLVHRPQSSVRQPVDRSSLDYLYDATMVQQDNLGYWLSLFGLSDIQVRYNEASKWVARKEFWLQLQKELIAQRLDRLQLAQLHRLCDDQWTAVSLRECPLRIHEYFAGETQLLRTPFERAVKAVKLRRCVVDAGYAYMPLHALKDVIHATLYQMVEHHLDSVMKQGSAVTSQAPLARITHPTVRQMVLQFWQQADAFNPRIVVPLNIAPSSFEAVRAALPPCMNKLFKRCFDVNYDKTWTNGDRMQAAATLVVSGVSQTDILSAWEGKVRKDHHARVNAEQHTLHKTVEWVRSISNPKGLISCRKMATTCPFAAKSANDVLTREARCGDLCRSAVQFKQAMRAESAPATGKLYISHPTKYIEVQLTA